jgi:sugar phosphate isomerase/epimerase
MKFALTRSAFPQWDLPTLAAKAAEHGYDGVEWAGLAGMEGGTPVICLASEIAMTGRARANRRAADEVCRYIDAARAVGCPYVKILDTTLRGERTASAVEMGHWLVPLGDYAARHGVTILVENRLTFRRSRDLWLVMEAANHPAVAAAWDVDVAGEVGEPPGVSVPTLNHRIQYAQFTWRVGGENAIVGKLLTRLLGIGYEGWVALHAVAESAEGPDVLLRDVLKQLRDWGTPRHPRIATAAPTKQAMKH